MQKKTFLTNLGNNIPPALKRVIQDNATINTIPYPRILLKTENSRNSSFFNEAKNKDIYKLLVRNKSRMPVGMHKWELKYNLLPERILNAFTFPWKSTLSTKSRNIQYKISTFTLPTGEYLWNYNVKVNYYCEKCLSDPDLSPPERDNILHSLFLCPKLQPFLSQIFSFLINECKAANEIKETA